MKFCCALQGRITKNDIDARMLKALADLPVDLGIEAIDKFAMASLDSVRSKTGFMVHRLPSFCIQGWLSVLPCKLQQLILSWHVGPADGDHQACAAGPLRSLQGPVPSPCSTL